MATQSVANSLPVRTAKQNNFHPLAPLDRNEINNAVSLVRAQWPEGTDLHFKTIMLQEPAKADMVPYLKAESQGTHLPAIDRRVFVTYYLRMTVGTAGIS